MRRRRGYPAARTRGHCDRYLRAAGEAHPAVPLRRFYDLETTVGEVDADVGVIICDVDGNGLGLLGGDADAARGHLDEQVDWLGCGEVPVRHCSAPLRWG